MSSTELQQVEASIARNKAIIAKGKALERLRNNPDFRQVIGEGYLVNEAVRLVHLKGSAHMQAPAKQLDIQGDIDAVGRFNQYLNSVGQFAAMAADSLTSDEATLEELAAEEISQ